MIKKKQPKFNVRGSFTLKDDLAGDRIAVDPYNSTSVYVALGNLDKSGNPKTGEDYIARIFHREQFIDGLLGAFPELTRREVDNG